MKKILFILLSTLSISCTQKPEPQFSLSGTTKGIEDGTMLYLYNSLTKENMDSAGIHNNIFTFNTVLPESPLRVILKTKDYSHYRFLWLENRPMTFDAGATNFREAQVTGSLSEELSQSLKGETDTLPEEEVAKKEIKFVRTHPNSIVSANILSVYATTWGKEKTLELFAQFSTENKNSVYGKKIENYIELMAEPDIGEKFVDFAMADVEGNPKKLSDVKGKVILLEFWASWCAPCRKENPNLVETYNRFHPKGFEIFAVSLDEEPENWLKAIEKDALTWHHVSDLLGSDNEAGLIYGVNGIPDNFLINEQGVIIDRNLRGEALNKKLEELLEL
ncbi:AhpC/TSA family protein [Ascidiimonas aurantiaca]|uniref:AhpC/TSA family protein n=1 Tax=Ascidiimonas aurantiaca TaxID=1685432 RepID=UPI0030EC2B02